MSFEVELKFHVSDAAALRRQLKVMGLVDLREIHQSDEYFKHPNRDFAKTDEAFRIRSQGDRACLTYKGPKLDDKSKTRREIEIGIDRNSSAQDLREMLVLLGFQPAGRVDKKRMEGAIQHGDRRVVVALDHVERLGDFVEFELVVENAQGILGAREAISELAQELKLGAHDRRGYIQMIDELGEAPC